MVEANPPHPEVERPSTASTIQEAANCMDKKAIQELKALGFPPPAVGQTLNLVSLILGEKQDWANAKKLMMNPRHLQERMENFDPTTLSKATVTKLSTAIADPDLSMEKVMRNSCAAGQFMNWVTVVHAEATKGC